MRPCSLSAASPTASSRIDVDFALALRCDVSTPLRPALPRSAARSARRPPCPCCSIAGRSSDQRPQPPSRRRSCASRLVDQRDRAASSSCRTARRSARRRPRRSRHAVEAGWLGRRWQLACDSALVNMCNSHSPSRVGCHFDEPAMHDASEQINMSACPFGCSGAFSDRRHLHHLAWLEDRSRGHHLHDHRRWRAPAAANACPTGATARRWKACARQIEAVAPTRSRRRRPRRPADADAGGRGAQRGRLRAVGPGGQARAAFACRDTRRPAPPRAARDRLHAVARRRRRRWPHRRAPMPRGRCSRSRSAAKATSRASARWSRPRPTAASSSTPTKAGPTTTSRENLAVAAELGIALIEQPLPAGQDADPARTIAHPVPICADESVHERRRPRRAGRALRRRQHQARQDRRADGGAAAARPGAASSASRSWSAAWSARRLPWRRPCCWRRTPISSISTGRCCWRATARPASPTAARWSHRRERALWG